MKEHLEIELELNDATTDTETLGDAIEAAVAEAVAAAGYGEPGVTILSWTEIDDGR